MNRTVVFAAVLSVVATAAGAQPKMTMAAAGPVFGMAMSVDEAKVDADAVRIPVDFLAAGRETLLCGLSFSAGGRSAAEATAPSHLRLDLVADARLAGLAWTIDDQRAITVWTTEPEASTRRSSNINWIGLLSEQVRVDAIMHFKRLTEAKILAEVEHSSRFGGYVEAVKSYFTTGGRWNDGDKFVNNDINHPIMGAFSSHVYTNNDRRCTNLAYGEQRYWSCIARATVYSTLASVNWEWNP